MSSQSLFVRRGGRLSSPTSGILLIAIFVLGMCVRLGIGLRAGAWEPSLQEPVNIAVALATRGVYADAYGPGVGPTAHTPPVHPLMLSVLFRIFGTGSAGALAMSVLGCAESALAFALLPLLAEASGLGVLCGALAGFAGALAPVNTWPQIRGAFEAQLTALLLVVLLILMAKAWEAQSLAKRAGVRFGIAAGVAMLTNPVLLSVVSAWLAATVLRFRKRGRQPLWFAAIAALCCAALLAPWAIRNRLALGEFVWTRSNFGLELQVSNNDWVTPDLERNVRMPQFALVHPYAGAGERAKVREMGELAYEHAKLHQALQWIQTHPRRFTELSVERFRLFWLPRMARPWQTALEWILTLAALAGLVLMFRERRASAWIFALVFAIYPLPYYVVQVSPRYRFPLELPMFLLAAQAFLILSGVHKQRARSEFRALLTASVVQQTQRTRLAKNER